MAQSAEDYRAPIEVKELASSPELGFRVNGPWLPLLKEAGLGDFQSVWHCDRGEVIKARPGLEIRRLALAPAAGDDVANPVVVFIKKHEQEISRAALMEQLNQSFGLITPEMAEVVSGVKGILFGEAMSESAIAAPPYAIGEPEFVSPLAM